MEACDQSKLMKVLIIKKNSKKQTPPQKTSYTHKPWSL